jgi:D-amino-acid oxidase
MRPTCRFHFIVPRNNNIVIVGGFSEPIEPFEPEKEEEYLNLTFKSPYIRKLCERAREFLPGLDLKNTDPAYALAQGLRPARHGDVRVERELRPPQYKNLKDVEHSRIVHSYGHAGSGWSFAFGCALDVVVLVEQAIRQAPPTALKDSSTLAQRQLGRQLSDARDVGTDTVQN